MASSSGVGKKRLSMANVPSSHLDKKPRKFADIFSSRIEKDRQSHTTDHIKDPLFWGPYLAERQWGTVREDYSVDGSCWDYSNYWLATKQAYHWGEDGLLGISDKFGMLCASLALWNKKDAVLKERLFGLTGKEGNHGEDVKELYFYVDNTPTHTYMQALYKYPQMEFPYTELTNHKLTPKEGEKEIIDTGVFDNQNYWDVKVEYAKPSPQSIVCRITVINRSSKHAAVDVIPQFCFRNTWSKLGCTSAGSPSPLFHDAGGNAVDAVYEMGIFRINFLYGSNVTMNRLLFTDNDSTANEESQGDTTTSKGSPLICGKKDAFHRFIINGEEEAVKSINMGTKCCAWMSVELDGNAQTSMYWQIFPADILGDNTIPKLDQILKTCKSKANDFYMKVIPKAATKEEANICRQAIAGMLWSKQFYYYNLDKKNKELQHLHPKAEESVSSVKKKLQWTHMNCEDIILMPDKWEFPWFAAWDLAFHCVQFARIDAAFAKGQILLLLSDRYMHPSGQVPGCEFDLGDPNPPLMAWAVWNIFKQDGGKDFSFLKTCFNRLIFSFQWWTKMDPNSHHLYGHGFMGLDNISVFDRSKLPEGASSLKQADCTGWMGLFSLNMLQISLELSNHDCSYADMAIKFIKNFLQIAKAINRSVQDGGLWLEEDKFFYDVLYYQHPHRTALRVRSWTGIIPLLACSSIDLKKCPLVKSFLLKCDRSFSPFVCKLGENEFFLTLVSYTKVKVMLKIVFAENEFLSPFGIRSLSKVYEESPYTFDVGGESVTLRYMPGESETDMFGGNSNWRGPIWLCMNYLFVECLEKYSNLDRVFTLPLTVQYPTGRNSKLTFLAIAQDLSRRIVSLFISNMWGARPIHGEHSKYSKDSNWQSLVLFYEYFHAETGRGCGASHQTGWSALVLEFLHKIYSTQPTK